MTFLDKVKESMSVLDLSNYNELDESIIRKAYLKKSKIYHPDVCAPEFRDGVMFKKINEANSFLKDNLNDVNSALKNPEKYNFEPNQSVNNNYNYQYQNVNVDDLFKQIFNEFVRQNSKTYSKEEINKINKQRRRMLFKRRLFASLGLAFGLCLMLILPELGVPLSIISLFMFL
jgi:DnaJ-class molecular chaperone